jgi:hypothetical protein
MLLAGHALGASLVALFVALGSGTFAKSSDIAADIAAREAGISEADSENPATIADLAGDITGQGGARAIGAFQTIVAENLAAMLAGAMLYRGNAELSGVFAIIFFPLLVRAFGLIGAMFGVMVVRTDDREAPASALFRGLYVSTLLQGLGLAGAAKWLLGKYWLAFFGCGVVGIVSGLGLAAVAQYFVEQRNRPLRDLAEAARGGAFAAGLSIQVLTRAWQLLTKGLQDMRDAPRPLAAADMVLVRLAYAADLPTPDDVLRKLASAPHSAGDGRTPLRSSAPSGGGGASAMAAPRTMSVAASTPMPQQRPTAQAQVETQPQARVEIPRFEDLVTLAQVNRDIQLKIALEQDVRLVRFERGSIEFSLTPGASPQLAQTLMRRLQEWTGIRWMVAISREEGAPTLKDQAETRAEEKMTGVRAIPLVRKVLEAFPGAQIMAIRAPEVEPEPVTAAIAPETADGGDEVGYADQIYTEDDL